MKSREEVDFICWKLIGFVVLKVFGKIMKTFFVCFAFEIMHWWIMHNNRNTWKGSKSGSFLLHVGFKVISGLLWACYISRPHEMVSSPGGGALPVQISLVEQCEVSHKEALQRLSIQPLSLRVCLQKGSICRQKSWDEREYQRQD